MSNPFEDPDGGYQVLINAEGQHSLWPAALEVPAGWTVVRGADTREACLRYIDEHWTDLRPAGLIRAMDEAAAQETVSTR
jgi:MbtH protein